MRLMTNNVMPATVPVGVLFGLSGQGEEFRELHLADEAFDEPVGDAGDKTDEDGGDATQVEGDTPEDDEVEDDEDDEVEDEDEDDEVEVPGDDGAGEGDGK